MRKAAKKARRAAAKAQNIEGMGEGMGEKKARKAAKRAAKKEQAAREAAERAERDATEKQAAERATQETANEVTVKQEVTRCARDVVGMDALAEETIGKGSGATPHEAGQNGVIGLDELAQLKQEIQNLKEAHQTLLSQADRIIMKITYMEDRLRKSLQTEDENGITSGIGVELAVEAVSVHRYNGLFFLFTVTHSLSSVGLQERWRTRPPQTRLVPTPLWLARWSRSSTPPNRFLMGRYPTIGMVIISRDHPRVCTIYITHSPP